MLNREITLIVILPPTIESSPIESHQLSQSRILYLYLAAYLELFLDLPMLFHNLGIFWSIQPSYFSLPLFGFVCVILVIKCRWGIFTGLSQCLHAAQYTTPSSNDVYLPHDWGCSLCSFGLKVVSSRLLISEVTIPLLIKILWEYCHALPLLTFMSYF